MDLKTNVKVRSLIFLLRRHDAVRNQTRTAAHTVMQV
jgi:hypothetical protein